MEHTFFTFVIMMRKVLLVSILWGSFFLSYADEPDSTRITYKIPTKVNVNNAFPVVAKPVVVGRTFFNDSLQNVATVLSRQNDSILGIVNEQEARLQAMEVQTSKLSEENKNLSSELENANGDKLQSSHTNSILYIFNVLVGIILLIALVWIMNKKKTRESDKSASNGFSRNGTHEVYISEPSLDHRLERIEKLGNLRDKGLLTDEEFVLQKKQILAERI